MKGLLGLGFLLLGFSFTTQSTDVKDSPNGAVGLKVTTKSGARNKTAPFLHGLFFEDINVSYFPIFLQYLPGWSESQFSILEMVDFTPS